MGRWGDRTVRARGQNHLLDTVEEPTQEKKTPSFVLPFYWRIIDLQCCVSFCGTTQWISSVCTYIPFLPRPAPIPPLSVITEHWAELPVLHSSFPLAIFAQASVFISSFKISKEYNWIDSFSMNRNLGIKKQAWISDIRPARLELYEEGSMSKWTGH